MSNFPTPTLQKRNINWYASVLKVQFLIVISTQHLQTRLFYAIPYYIYIYKIQLQLLSSKFSDIQPKQTYGITAIEGSKRTAHACITSTRIGNFRWFLSRWLRSSKDRCHFENHTNEMQSQLWKPLLEGYKDQSIKKYNTYILSLLFYNKAAAMEKTALDLNPQG
jgi:hypothetical protein